MIDFKNLSPSFKILIYAMIVLVICVPVGLIASGTAFGEWGTDELQQDYGSVPAGFASLTGLWHAPLDGYDLPGNHETIPTQTPGYYVSAIVGCLVVGGVAFLVSKALIKRSD